MRTQPNPGRRNQNPGKSRLLPGHNPREEAIRIWNQFLTTQKHLARKHKGITETHQEDEAKALRGAAVTDRRREEETHGPSEVPTKPREEKPKHKEGQTVPGKEHPEGNVGERREGEGTRPLHLCTSARSSTRTRTRPRRRGEPSRPPGAPEETGLSPDSEHLTKRGGT